MQPDTYSPDTNYPILAAIRANDRQALEELYQREYPEVEKYILNNKGTAEQAKDIFQEAFIVVWRNVQLNKFQPQHETALGGYLYQIAKHKWLDFLRSGYYKNIVMSDDRNMNFDIPDELPADREEYIREVKDKFGQLGDNCRELLTRFYYKNQSLTAIAAAMKWTEPTARNNKYRCMERLREMLKRK